MPSVSKAGKTQEKPVQGKTLGLKLVVGYYSLVGVLMVLFGLLFTLFAAAFASLIKSMAAGFLAGIIGAVFGILGVVILLFGVLFLVLAFYLWKLKNGARIIISVFAVLGLLAFPLGTIVNGLILYFLWFDASTKALFK